MSYKFAFTIDELISNVQSLSSPEVKEGFSQLNFESVKNNFIDVVKNRYFCFEGTAGRKEFWQYIIVPVVLMVATNILTTILGIILKSTGYYIGSTLSTLVSLALVCPTLGVTARRLHDTGKSGWLQLIGIIPVIGWLVVWALCLGKKAEDCCCCCEQK